MKSLFLLRHAKAEDSANRDVDRRLSEKGRREAKEIGDHLAKLQLTPTAIVTSSAPRARETAEIVASRVGFAGDILLRDELYLAEPETLRLAIASAPAGDRLLLVAHNPGLEALVASLTQSPNLAVHLPTAGLARLDSDKLQWSEAIKAPMTLEWLFSPKSL